MIRRLVFACSLVVASAIPAAAQHISGRATGLTGTFTSFDFNGLPAALEGNLFTNQFAGSGVTFSGAYFGTQNAPLYGPFPSNALYNYGNPGTTDELILPLLEETGMKVGKDFFLAFSPERVDPGNARFNTRNIPKVVGGVTPACTEVAVKLYRQRLETVVPVSSTQVAEMVKLLENTFRSVNIGLVNELALMCSRLGIDVWEVITAAATKPFGFMPFYPGPGLGGHCIPIDPFYLSWKARASGFEARFIELAGHVNGQMPEHVVNLVAEALNRRGKAVRGSRVLVLGVAYKAEIDDTRESPSLDIMETLRERGARIEYSDPFVPQLEFAGRRLKSVPLSPNHLKRFDCAVIATAHSAVSYASVLKYSKAVVDTRNALKGRKSEKIVRL